jgi:hypothetical protein
MSTPTKMPAGLPALPPVPDGYSRWEYKGKGWRNNGKPVGAPWGVAYTGGSDWWEHSGMRTDTAKLGQPNATICEGHSLHVIVAVRDAKPAKKATKKKAKRVKVRARVMFTCGEDNVTVPIERAKYYSGPYPVSPVLVIPFDAASREAIVEQMAEELLAVHRLHLVKGKARAGLIRSMLPSARAILATLHPDFAKEGGR